QRGDGEDPRRVDLLQARRAGPGRGDRLRVRPRGRGTPPGGRADVAPAGRCRRRPSGARCRHGPHHHLHTPPAAGPAGRGATAAVDHVLEVQGLTKRYRRAEVLRDVSFRVRRGELYGLLGTNGAGKTTTVEILQGLRTASGGTVRVLGLDPAAAGDELRRRIG